MSRRLVRLPAEVVRERVRLVSAGFPGLVAAYLFGSAHGEFRPDSDVDVGVILRDGEDQTTEDRLEVAMGSIDGHPLHVTTLHEGDAFSFRVLREGKLLFTADETLRTDFLARAALQHYYDAPHLRTAQEALREMVGF